MEELEIIREKIREIDKDLIVLFEKRMVLSREVAVCKMKKQMPVYDAGREEKNIRELSELLTDISDRPYFRKWYQMLMDVSKEKQRDTEKEEK